MYSLSQVRRGVRCPRLALRELNRLYHRRLDRRDCYPRGTAIVEEDWDNLLVLDACRYDLVEPDRVPGRLEHRYSKGSKTEEFLRANFDGRRLLDTVYVTASPMLAQHRDEIDVVFHDTVQVWEEEGWNEEWSTVLPETVARRAKAATAEYPNKRLLVHFIQPHYPFIGADFEFDKGQLDDPDQDVSFWRRILMGELEADDRELREAYERNFERALAHVRDLVEHLDGRTVVTADHGNMIGDRSFPVPIKEYGHPPGTYVEPLVKVPWIVSDDGSRRTIVESDPESADGSNRTETEDVQSRLQSLGYTR